jgi:hypothetical protein
MILPPVLWPSPRCPLCGKPIADPVDAVPRVQADGAVVGFQHWECTR